MLSLPVHKLLPVPGINRRVLAEKKNRALLDAMAILFSSSERTTIFRYISENVTVYSDKSENEGYYQILEGVLPALALLSIDPQFIVTVSEQRPNGSKRDILLNYSEQFDLSTNYRKAILYQNLIRCGFKSRNVCKCFNISRVYLSKSKALLTLPEQYLSLFISGRIDDVNAAYTFHQHNNNERLLFFRLLDEGLSPRSALKFIDATATDSAITNRDITR